MRIKHERIGQQGFTVVELLVATSIFSIILLLCSMSIIQISRLYLKGIVTNRTQEVARTVTDEIIRTVQFSGNDVKVLTPITLSGGFSGSVKGFCVGTRRFSYVVDLQLTEGPNDTANKRIKHVLVADEEPDCTAATPPAPQQLADPVVDTDSKELIGVNMRLADDPTPAVIAATPSLYRIKLNVVYGDQDLLEGSAPNYSCKASRVGGQFCALSSLNTVVEKRVK